jgi:voltage-gated potassium channel
MRINTKIGIYTLAIAGVVAYGTVGALILGNSGNFNVNITSPIQALYFTIVTISTVGYGDITPVTDVGRIFTIILIISGLSIFLSAVTVLSSDFLSSRMERLYSKASGIEKRKFKNHVILIGYSATNTLLAQRLKAQNRRFIILTANKTRADELFGMGYDVFLVDYTLDKDMRQFAIERARDVVIDLTDSSKTIYVVLVIRKLSKTVRISIVAQSQDVESHLADLQINNIINPVTIAADKISSIISEEDNKKVHAG